MRYQSDLFNTGQHFLVFPSAVHLFYPQATLDLPAATTDALHMLGFVVGLPPSSVTAIRALHVLHIL